MNAVDTNVLVYAVDRNEPIKRQKARALLAQLARDTPQPVLLWQVAVEFVACLKRWEQKSILSSAETLANWQLAEREFTIVPPRSNLISSALDLLQRHSLSYWDALLLAACIEAGIDILYSEDLSDGAIYDSVKVLNPFA